MKLRRAVVTAAGRDGQQLPLQRLIDRDGVAKTALQIVVEEAVAAGLEAGKARAELAVVHDLTRPRVTQLLDLLRLHPNILAEIREANLSYLMLAQNLIRADREQALFRLGVSEDTADILATLSPAQIMKVASGSTLLCQFRMNDDIVWNLLTNHGKVGSAANDGVSRLHASIVMAGRHQEAA
jgi:flagellar transcriptional activator FlhD